MTEIQFSVAKRLRASAVAVATLCALLLPSLAQNATAQGKAATGQLGSIGTQKDMIQAVRDAVDSFNHAFRTGSYLQVESTIAADYLHTNGGREPLDRERWLSWYRALAKRIREGEVRYVRYDMTEVTIRLAPRHAAVSARIQAEREEGDERHTIDVRTTQLWIRNGDIWQRALFHDTPTYDAAAAGMF